MGIIAPKARTAAFRVFLLLILVVFSPIFVVAVLLYFLWGAILYLAIWFTAGKQFVVFVYSDSPNWKDYIEKEILPYVRDRAVILNWSERRNWNHSLAVLAFRYFGGQRNFNPMGMVFRPFHFVKTYRFFEAFREFKHSSPEKVQSLRKELLAEIGIHSY